MAAIGSRSPTFLANHEWKTIPWSIDPSSKDLGQHILDHFADIPTLLAEFDILAGAPADANSGTCPGNPDRRATFCSLLVGLEHRLHEWKREYADPRGQPFEEPLPVKDPTELQTTPTPGNLLPIFRCRDVNGEIFTPTLISYPDPDLACALCIYYSSLLVISVFDIRTEGKIQPQEQYNLACYVCRSMEYFTKILSKDNLAQVLFGLRVAYDTFPMWDVERRWVEDVFQLIGRTSKMKACESLARSFSVLKRDRFGVPGLSDVASL